MQQPAGFTARAARADPVLVRLAQLGGLLCLLMVAGTVGLALTESTSIWHAFVWTLDTMATVGSIPEPESPAAQVLKVVLIILGVGTLLYALVTTTGFFVAGHLTELLKEGRTRRVIDSLSDHYVIRGFGRVARQIARDLRAAGARYVVIDPNGKPCNAATRQQIAAAQPTALTTPAGDCDEPAHGRSTLRASYEFIN